MVESTTVLLHYTLLLHCGSSRHFLLYVYLNTGYSKYNKIELAKFIKTFSCTSFKCALFVFYSYRLLFITHYQRLNGQSCN